MWFAASFLEFVGVFSFSLFPLGFPFWVFSALLVLADLFSFFWVSSRALCCLGLFCVVLFSVRTFFFLEFCVQVWVLVVWLLPGNIVPRRAGAGACLDVAREQCSKGPGESQPVWMYTRQKQSSGGPEDMPFLNWSSRSGSG